MFRTDYIMIYLIIQLIIYSFDYDLKYVDAVRNYRY